MVYHPGRVSCAALLLALAACMGPAASPGTNQNRVLLSTDEMEKAGYPDAFATVQSLRPQWLQRRGPTSSRAQSIKVYLDGSLMGGPEHLRQIPTRSISSIRYLTGLEASGRYGFDHDLGAILVTTRRN